MKKMKDELLLNGVDEKIVMFTLLASVNADKDLSFESNINLNNKEKITFISPAKVNQYTSLFTGNRYSILKLKDEFYTIISGEEEMKPVVIDILNEDETEDFIKNNCFKYSDPKIFKDYKSITEAIENDKDLLSLDYEDRIEIFIYFGTDTQLHVISISKDHLLKIFSTDKNEVEKRMKEANLEFRFLSKDILVSEKDQKEIDNSESYKPIELDNETSRNSIGEANGVSAGIPLETLRRSQEIAKEVVNDWKSGTLLDGNKMETVTIEEPKIVSSTNFLNPYTSAVMSTDTVTTPLNDGISFEATTNKIIDELDAAAENNKTAEEINMLQKYYKALPVGFYNIINNTTDVVFISDAFSNIKDLNPSEEDKVNILNFAIFKFKDEKFIQDEYEKVFYNNTENTLKAEMNKVINKEESKNDILSMMGLNNKEVKIVPPSSTTPTDSSSLENQVKEIKNSKENTEVKPRKYGLLNVTTESQYGIDQIIAKKNLFHDPVNDPEEIAFTNLLQNQNDQINARVNTIRKYLMENGIELTLTPELNLISNQPGIFGTPVEKLKESYKLASDKFLQDIKSENIAYEVAEKLTYAERMIKLIDLEKANSMSVNATSPLTNIAGLNFNKN